MRKTIIIILLILCAAGLTANPLLGTWRWKLLFDYNEEGYFEFREDGICLTGDNPDYLDELVYTINENENILYLDDIPWRYETDGTNITLYISDSEIMDEMMKEILDISEFEDVNINGRNLAEDLFNAIMGVFSDYPFLEAERIESIPYTRRKKR